MGFKRTSDGRVFFNAEDNDSAQESAAPLTPITQKKPTKPLPKSYADFDREIAKKPTPTAKRQMPVFKEQIKEQNQFKPQKAASNPQSAQTQAQIITLLKTLNERLKITQGERDKMLRELENYRGQIEDLEEKAQRNERITLDLEARIERDASSDEINRQLAETRKAIAGLDQKHDTQARTLADKITKSATQTAALTRRLQSTETKQAEIGEKVDGAIADQARLTRKIDKAIEDRARFMRKIERIEETVIQTRDSLNAKAMVVLADQSVAGHSATPIEPEDLKHVEKPPQTQQQQAQQQGAQDFPSFPAPEYKLDTPWYKSYKSLTSLKSAAILTSVVIVGGIAALLLNQGFKSNDQIVTQPIATQSQDRFGNAQPIPQANRRPIPEAIIIADSEVTADILDLPPITSTTAPAENLQAQNLETMEWEVEESPPARNEQEARGASDDIGAIDLRDEARVEALLDTNPRAVARALNDIEPQRINEAAEPIIEQPTEIVDAPPVQSSSSERELRSMIAADATLPNAVKPVENQAFQGVAEAQHDLAAIYTAGHGGVEQNFERAAFWFERAAENNIANASYNLGVLHHQGLGVDADIARAMQYYEQAAANNHPEAQYNLGIAYIEGIGVEYNPARAAGHFENAANNGIMEAAYNLGLVHENGLLGNIDNDKALIWYKKAADEGSVEARQALEQLAQRLNVPTSDISRIAETLSAANNVIKSATTSSEALLNAPETTMPNSIRSSQQTTDQAVIAQIQEYLMASGLYPGPADGLSGALTQDAIRAYQSSNGLASNGVPSSALLSHMLGNANALGSR